MKFIKVLWFDLKNGYFKGVSCYIFPLFIAIIGFFELHRRIAIWGTEVALGDYWMYLYGGMKEYIPTTGNPFQFPTMWIAVFLFSSFAVLNYPMKIYKTWEHRFWYMFKDEQNGGYQNVCGMFYLPFCIMELFYWY